jgi:hypothetical protein
MLRIETDARTQPDQGSRHPIARRILRLAEPLTYATTRERTPSASHYWRGRWRWPR